MNSALAALNLDALLVVKYMDALSGLCVTKLFEKHRAHASAHRYDLIVKS